MKAMKYIWYEIDKYDGCDDFLLWYKHGKEKLKFIYLG